MAPTNAAVFAARPGGVARAFLRVNDFAGAARANETADAAEHADHVVIQRIQVFFMRHEHLRHEPEQRNQDRLENRHQKEPGKAKEDHGEDGEGKTVPSAGAQSLRGMVEQHEPGAGQQ